MMNTTERDCCRHSRFAHRYRSASARTYGCHSPVPATVRESCPSIGQCMCAVHRELNPDVESVTTTHQADTATYYAFDPSNSAIAPRTFVISALP